MAARRVRVQIAADESQLLHATLELRGTIHRRGTRRLGQLANSHEVLGIQRAHAINQIVAGPSPALTRGFVADVVSHGRSARRENRKVRAPGALQLELRILQAVADLIIADRRLRTRGNVKTAFKAGELFVAEFLKRGGRSRVVAMAIDDHACAPNLPNTCASDYPRESLPGSLRRGRSPQRDRPIRRRSACPS